MKDFEKKWNKAKDELIDGNKKYCYYSLNKDKKSINIANNSTNVDTLLVYWQIGNNTIFKGFLNGISVGFTEDEGLKESQISIVIDFSNSKNIDILAIHKEMKQLYDNKVTNKDMTHKLIILQENRYFIDLIVYDSETGCPPARIVFKEEVNRRHLKNLAYSLFGGLDESIYKIIENDEC